jgi:hypothetical protein
MNNTQDALNQAFDAGFKAGQEMGRLARIAEEGPLSVAGLDIRGREINGPTKIVVRRVAKAPTKAAAAPIDRVTKPKATTVARSAKKAAGPRTKGVKERIVALIAAEPISVSGIISKTGFLETSVRATLMGLKKDGLAMNEDKLWFSGAPVSGPGNSEAGTEIGI